MVRPTGLVDPEVECAPATHQWMTYCRRFTCACSSASAGAHHHLTKRMAEQLTDYLSDNGVRCAICILTWTRWSAWRSSATCAWGRLDVLVGINLLREGLDIPRCRWWRFWMPTKGFLRASAA